MLTTLLRTLLSLALPAFVFGQMLNSALPHMHPADTRDNSPEMPPAFTPHTLVLAHRYLCPLRDSTSSFQHLEACPTVVETPQLGCFFAPRTAENSLGGVTLFFVDAASCTLRSNSRISATAILRDLANTK